MYKCLLPAALALLTLAQTSPPATAPSQIKITESPTTLTLTIDGQPFTTYRFTPTPDDPHWRRPYFYPVLAADGTELTADQTRQLPSNPQADHPHQRSVWVGHGDVNGADHWRSTAVHQRHRRFTTIAENTFTEELSWDSAGDNGDKDPVLTETRTVRIHAYPDGTRALDVSSTFTAPTADAVFRCRPLNLSGVEAGLLAARLPAAITQAPRAQQLITAAGLAPVTGEADARATPNTWCDYSGPIGGKTYGIALVDFPANPGGPTPFHVRHFGLLTRIGPLQWTLKKSESATFRHLLLFHTGSAADARIEEKAKAWRDQLPPNPHAAPSTTTPPPH